MRFAGKTIGVGVSASVAIYKALDLVKRLRDQGATVRVVMTPHATELIRPQLFAAVAGQPVHVELFGDGLVDPMPHVSGLSQVQAWLVAPATASVIGRLAWALATDLLSTVLLATSAPVLIAPAMNTAMLEHPLVQDNLARLRGAGIEIVPPCEGQLACGVFGAGHLAHADTLEIAVERALTPQDWKGKRVLIALGATQESIDPVRVITNRSSGRMGLALARAAWVRGAEVTVVAGVTTVVRPVWPQMVWHDVTSTEAMAAVVVRLFPDHDAYLSAAAVADFAPTHPLSQKFKKSSNPSSLTLSLKPNSDILEMVRDLKRPDQKVVGFVLETEALEARALDKLQRKGLDLVVGNAPEVLDQDEGRFLWLDAVDRSPRSLHGSKELLGHQLLTRLSELMKS